MARQETNKAITYWQLVHYKSHTMTQIYVIICNKLHCNASPVPCPVLQTDYIFATVPNLQKDSANVSNGADGSAGNSGISWMVMFCNISVRFF